jgi:hypothetical protein
VAAAEAVSSVDRQTSNPPFLKNGAPEEVRRDVLKLMAGSEFHIITNHQLRDLRLRPSLSPRASRLDMTDKVDAWSHGPP